MSQPDIHALTDSDVTLTLVNKHAIPLMLEDHTITEGAWATNPPKFLLPNSESATFKASMSMSAHPSILS